MYYVKGILVYLAVGLFIYGYVKLFGIPFYIFV